MKETIGNNMQGNSGGSANVKIGMGTDVSFYFLSHRICSDTSADSFNCIFPKDSLSDNVRMLL